MHNSIRNALQSGQHVLGHHWIWKEHGLELGEKAREHNRKLMQRHWGRDLTPQQIMGLQGLLYQIADLEAQHRPQLVSLAKDLMAEMYPDFPRDHLILLLGPDKIRPPAAEPAPPERDIKGQVDQDTQDRIDHRVTMNTVTQGAAIHLYKTLHHKAQAALEAIDPQLMELYGKIISGSMEQYWMFPLDMLLQQLTQNSIGSEEVLYDPGEIAEARKEEQDYEGQQHEIEFSEPTTYQDEEEEEAPEPEDQSIPVLRIRALIFPVLLQECVKGIMEVANLGSLRGRTLPGGKEDEEQKKLIHRNAEKREYEIFHIQKGDEVYRRMLKALTAASEPPSKMAALSRALSDLEPSNAKRVMKEIIDQTELAAEMVKQLIGDKEPEWNEDHLKDEEDGPDSWGSPNGPGVTESLNRKMEQKGQWSPDDIAKDLRDEPI